MYETINCVSWYDYWYAWQHKTWTNNYIRRKKINTSIAFITQSYFAVPLNTCKILEIKIPNKRELQQIVFNNSSAFGFNDFMKLYKKSTNDLYSCLVSYATLPSDNNLRFRCDLFEEVKQRN